MNDFKKSLLETIKIEINKSTDALKTNIFNKLVAENKRLSRKCQHREERIENLSDRIYEAELTIPSNVHAEITLNYLEFLTMYLMTTLKVLVSLF